MKSEPSHRIGISTVDSGGFSVMSNVRVNAHGFEASRLAINEYTLATLVREKLSVPQTV